MYQETLKKLGLDEKEIAVFIAVLERGRVSPAIVAKVTGINRSTVYSVAKVLADQGLLRIDTTVEPAYLVVESAEVLKTLVSRQERELAIQKSLVADAMKQLESVPQSKRYSVPKVKFYNEKEMKDALYNRLPIWAESAIATKEPSWWGFQDASLVENFPEWVVDHYSLIPKEVSTHLFTNAKHVEKDIHKQISDSRRTVKYLNEKTTEFTATQAVLGDYIIYAMTDQKPFYMIEIHDRVMAHNFRQVFKLMWNLIS
jgi:predicted DNA-binding transcriptional regulator